MTDVDFAKHLRSLLSSPPNSTVLTQCIDSVSARVVDISSADDPAERRKEFEDELQAICDHVLDHSQPNHLEIILNVLHNASPILPSTSLISNWFMLVLRPALREPRLSQSARDRAKELVLLGLDVSRVDDDADAAFEFRHRIVNLYLHDAYNENCGDDVLEFAELEEQKRQSCITWKSNLEDILLQFGLLRPDELLDVLSEAFLKPSCRLQIMVFLDLLVSHSSLTDTVLSVLHSLLFQRVLQSLQVDDSSTACSIGLAILVKLLPDAAIRAYDRLKQMLPQLYSILGRVLCWKTHHDHSAEGIRYRDLLDRADEPLIQELEKNEQKEDLDEALEQTSSQLLQLREDLEWERLVCPNEAASAIPARKQFFQFLYFLFPVNTVFFLRRTAKYLQDSGLVSPWTVTWEEAMDDLQIRTTSTLYLRTLVMHPSVIWYDAQTELEEPNRWSSYNVSRIVGECTMLDYSNAFLAAQESQDDVGMHLFSRHRDDDATVKGFGSSEAGATSTSHTVSLPEISVRSHALRANRGIDSGHATPVWPSLFNASSSFSTPVMHFASLPLQKAEDGRNETEAAPVLTQTATEIVSDLQRKVLLLQTELQFELWLKRENMRHVGRLHQDHVVTRRAELERQQLHNRLREYKSQLLQLQQQLKKHQDQATDMKQKHVEWSTQLLSKLTSLREEKKTWMGQATALNSANLDLTAHLTAQSRLLAEARNEVFQLETKLKMDDYKVQRLRDYEQRIEQLTEMHRMWNKDIVLYNEQSRMMARLTSEHATMSMQVESYERTLTEMEENALTARRQIQVLEASLESARRSSSVAPPIRPEFEAARSAEKAALVKQSERLREENLALRDELEEMRAMVEVLKAQLTGRTGLVDLEAILSP